jgi:hypothetical protein
MTGRFLNIHGEDKTPFITEVEMLIGEFHGSCIQMAPSNSRTMKPRQS